MTSVESPSHQPTLTALAQMANTVGHELRNPLAVIQNGVYLLGMMISEEDPSVRETLDLVSGEVEETVRLINSLLDFGRPRTFKPRETNVNDLMTHAMIQVTMPPEIELRTDLAPAMPPVVIDMDQMALALRKLIDNAVKSIPEKGEITLSTASTTDQILIKITDTGVGIPETDLERIFEPLFTTRTHSIGLGLTVARVVIEDHGGTLAVESRLGEGTTFTVCLPRSDSAD